MEIILLGCLAIFSIVILLLSVLKRQKLSIPIGDRIFAGAWLILILAFAFSMLFHSNPYHRAIDPIDGECYSPFGDGQLPTVIFYGAAFYIGTFLLWRRETRLPPLTAVLSAVFVCVGIVLNVLFFIQLLGHDTSSVDTSGGSDDMLFMVFLPLFNIVAGIIVLMRTVFKRVAEAPALSYKNPWLNRLNNLLIRRVSNPQWMLILFLPVLLLSTLILLLFGQEYNSLVKVFTDTTTWTFSQKTHPPILDHQGHYLCTVAAKGSPDIVKPVCLGKRGGRTIIVNRQLQIANAFEEWVHDVHPRAHQFIRRNYDKYGYNLSVKINTPFWSNVTYILMKPWEWLFLIFLYLFCLKPEEKIKNQYS